MSARRLATWWVVASAASYPMFTVFSKWALAGLRPTDVLFWSFVIAAPSAFAVVMLRRRRLGPAATAAPGGPFLLAAPVTGATPCWRSWPWTTSRRPCTR